MLFTFIDRKSPNPKRIPRKPTLEEQENYRDPPQRSRGPLRTFHMQNQKNSDFLNPKSQPQKAQILAANLTCKTQESEISFQSKVQFSVRNPEKVNSRKTEILAGKSSDPTEGGGRNRNPGSKSSGILEGKREMASARRVGLWRK